MSGSLHDTQTARPRRAIANLVIAVLATCLSLAAAAQSTPPVTTPEPQPPRGLEGFNIPTLKLLENYSGLRTEMAWHARSREAELGPDLNGRTLAQNAEQYVLTPAAASEFDGLVAKARAQSAANDAEGLAATLHAATEIAANELARYDLIERWHSANQTIATHESALRAVAQKAPESERAAARARIDPLLDAARPVLAKLMALPRIQAPFRPTLLPEDLRTVFDDLVRAYNEERVRLVPFAQAMDEKNGIPRLSRERSVACGPPSPSPSTTDQPSLDTTTMSQPDFPAMARRQGFEGSVQLRAYISEIGCPERIEIYRSVGYLPLDESALRWAEGLRFHPLVKNGKPTATWYVFAVTFRLHD